MKRTLETYEDKLSELANHQKTLSEILDNVSCSVISINSDCITISFDKHVLYNVLIKIKDIAKFYWYILRKFKYSLIHRG